MHLDNSIILYNFVIVTALCLAYQENVLFVCGREYPQDQRVILSSTAEMKCQPHDTTDETAINSGIQWIFNNKNITQTNRIKILPDGTLRIEQVRNTDVGQYTCQWQSSASGVLESRSARLEIIELPHAPQQVRAELTDDGSAGVRVSWVPGFDGNSPIYKYSIEMRTVSSDNIDNELNSIMNSHLWEIAASNLSADHNSVVVRNLKPARKYVFRIRATNKVGTGQPSTPTRQPVEVPAQPPSAAPMNVVGSPRSSNSITIQWNPPQQDSQNGQLMGYIVRHRLAGYGDLSQWYNQSVTNPAHLSLVLDDLITWQSYEIQVAAYNEKGVGEFSPSTHVRTKEGRPEGSPRNVSAEAVSSTGIRVSWEPPEPQLINGINQGYKIQAWQDGKRVNLSREIVVNPNPLPSAPQSQIVENLQPYTNYYITVLCFTSAGDGPSNDPPLYVKTKQDIPEPVQSIEFSDILDKSLRISWTPPARANGILAKYTIEYSMLGNNNQGKTMERNVSGDVCETKIVDLSPHTSYKFTIYAHTSVGRGGGKTANTQTIVPPVLPEPPTNLAFSNITPFSVMLQFVPGFDGNASIDKWIVEAQLTHKSNKWFHIYTATTNHSTSAPSTSGVLTVRNLQPFTMYRLRLIPSNVVGPSRLPSEPSPEFQTLQVEPEHAPRNVILDGVSSTALRVRWQPLPPNLWYGNPRGYNITWFEPPNNPAKFVLINDTEADSFVIRDLEEFTDYVVKVFAVNDIGASPASDPVTYRTSEDTPSASPANITATPSSSNSISLKWSSVPKKHRNGVIRGYKIRYQIDRPGSNLEYKIVDNNSTKQVTLIDLKPYANYRISICAFTSLGDGTYSIPTTVQTHEGLPGQPSNLTFVSVSRSGAKIVWDIPEEPNGEILGYRVSYRVMTDQKEMNAVELPPTDKSLKVSNLDPDTHYVFTVSARTKEGWGRQANSLVYTTDIELRATLPIYRESWFVLLVASLSVVITVIITIALFLQSRQSKKNQNDKHDLSNSQDHFHEAGFIIEPDERLRSNYHNSLFSSSTGGLFAGGSSNTARRQSHGSTLNGSAHILTARNKSPSRPPIDIYSDGDDDVFADDEPVKGGGVAGCSSRQMGGVRNIGSGYGEDIDDSGDDEKPSPLPSSTGPESDDSDENNHLNDDEYVNTVNRQLYGNNRMYANSSLHKFSGNSGTIQSATWKRHAKSYVDAMSAGHGVLKGTLKLPQRPAPLVPTGIHNARPSSSGSSPMQKNGNLNHAVDMTDGVGVTSSLTSAPPSYSASVSGTDTIGMNAAVSNSTSNLDGNTVDGQDTSKISSSTSDLNAPMMNLNGGRIIVNNMAGSRAPLPGFTSFV